MMGFMGVFLVFFKTSSSWEFVFKNCNQKNCNKIYSLIRSKNIVRQMAIAEVMACLKSTFTMLFSILNFLSFFLWHVCRESTLLITQLHAHNFLTWCRVLDAGFSCLPNRPIVGVVAAIRKPTKTIINF